MKNNKTVTGIILTAGNSTRFKKNRNKNFEIINGKPVIVYSLEIFENSEYIDDIIIAVREKDREIVESILTNRKNKKQIKIIYGGQTRQESVYNSIKQTNSDIVVIHDGARPILQENYIYKCIDGIDNADGVSIAVKSKDTIKITNSEGVVVETTKRDNTWNIQTPQCFIRNILLDAHERYEKALNITDDCMLLEKAKKKVKLVEGNYTNIKITTQNDVALAKIYLDNNYI